uniref:Uncharacterized protein n=1 Tax=viral metagenome TaxID=1070528 RepID=A0A6M3LHA8_9ZZZZ
MKEEIYSEGREPAILCEVIRLGESIGDLRRIIADLQNRLAKVSREDNSPKNETAKEASATCELHGEIRSKRLDLDEIVAILEEQTRVLEV